MHFVCRWDLNNGLSRKVPENEVQGKMTTPRLILLFAVLHSAKPQRGNQSIWSKDQEARFENYKKVYLLEPKFKSKQLAGLGWYNQANLESGAGQRRHLEWLEGSASDSESAEPTEKGFLAEWFGEEEDDDDENISNVALKEDGINYGSLKSTKQYKKIS